jgi:hypothetical protein
VDPARRRACEEGAGEIRASSNATHSLPNECPATAPPNRPEPRRTVTAERVNDVDHRKGSTPGDRLNKHRLDAASIPCEALVSWHVRLWRKMAPGRSPSIHLDREGTASALGARDQASRTRISGDAGARIPWSWWATGGARPSERGVEGRGKRTNGEKRTAPLSAGGAQRADRDVAMMTQSVRAAFQ